MIEWKVRYKDQWTNGKWGETTAITDDHKTESDMIGFWGLDCSDVYEYELTHRKL